MASKVSIANGALERLGEKRIELLTQDDVRARSMNANFDSVRDALLRKYDWGFAIRRASIAADGSETLWGGHNRFGLPNDYIRLIRDDETGQAVDWRIEAGDAEGDGTFIVTDDASPLEIRYIARIEDPNRYDATFIEALECALAMKSCKRITGSDAFKTDLARDYADAIAEAKRTGAIEKKAQEAPEDDWLNARL